MLLWAAGAPCFPWLPAPTIGTLLPLQLPTSSTFPLPALLQKQADFFLLLLFLWKCIFFSSQGHSEMVLAHEERNRQV